MTMSAAPRENLAQIADRLRKLQRASSTGPLLVSEEVMRIANNWERYRAEAGDAECTTWCKKALGNTFAYYERRATAIRELGEAIRRTVSHDVAIWLVGAVQEKTPRDKAKFALMSECKKQHGHPLTKHQAVRVLRALKLIPPRKSRTCKRCAQLEQLLKKNGIESPDAN